MGKITLTCYTKVGIFQKLNFDRIHVCATKQNGPNCNNFDKLTPKSKWQENLGLKNGSKNKGIYSGDPLIGIYFPIKG
jgi:hypothetical protein